jgi:N-acetylmuramoyl-L-alanine amidase
MMDIQRYRKFSVGALLGLLFLTASVQAEPARDGDKPDETLGVVYADGRQTEDVGLYRVDDSSAELFMSAFDLARIFRATKYWNPGARRLSLRIDIHSYQFTLDTRLVIVDDETILLRVPVQYHEGSVMIPLEFISEILAPRSLERIELDEQRKVLTIGSPEYNVTDIRFVDAEDGTRAVLDLTEELLYHVDSETPGLLRLKIYGGRLNPLKFTISQGEGLFNRVRAEQTDRDSYLFFDVKRTASRFRVEFERDDEVAGEGKTLVIFLEKSDLPEIPEAGYADKRMLEILDEGAARAGRSPVRAVAIDPGHGGIDNGKIGPSGLKEKDVNLEIALLLRSRLIEELGVKVIMTRTDDTLVPLDRRGEIANSEGADIFISIHCNGWFTPQAGGFETFFLSPARTEEEARLAREENASLRFENSSLNPDEMDDLDFILWDMVQNEFISESSELAELIQRELAGQLEIRNRGVRQAGLAVLRGLHMPAVLCETAFLSNPREEELLLDPVFRLNYVRGIVEAVRRYQTRFPAAAGNGN